YTYDKDNELTKVADPSATLTFAYDSGGRQTTAVAVGAAGTLPLVTLTYGFDNVGNRTSMSDSLSSVGRTTYLYDSVNRLTTLTHSIGATAGPQVIFSYDPGNRMTTIARTIGGAGTPTYTTISYDAADRVGAIHTQKGTFHGAETVESFGYTYD